MQMLYDSERFVIVHIQTNSTEDSHLLNVSGKAMLNSSNNKQIPRNGFEIVDKRSGKEVFLDGSWAELFQKHLDKWIKQQPSQEEVEQIIAEYAALAQNPVYIN